jgi:hypothetical protein
MPQRHEFTKFYKKEYHEVFPFLYSLSLSALVTKLFKNKY